MALRAIRRAKNGYAINLHENRHRESRTYGSDGKCKRMNSLNLLARKSVQPLQIRRKEQLLLG